MAASMDTLGIEPRASRMLSGCDTTTPRALEVWHCKGFEGPSPGGEEKHRCRSKGGGPQRGDPGTAPRHVIKRSPWQSVFVAVLGADMTRRAAGAGESSQGAGQRSCCPCRNEHQQHQWSSGRIHRCHRCDPGSIPG